MIAKYWWLIIGLMGQLVFSARFLVQWVVSEKLKKSVIPHAFWYLSLIGGMILLMYAIHKKDLVFIIGQASGVIIYARNLYFIRREFRADLSNA